MATVDDNTSVSKPVDPTSCSAPNGLSSTTYLETSSSTSLETSSPLPSCTSSKSCVVPSSLSPEHETLNGSLSFSVAKNFGFSSGLQATNKSVSDSLLDCKAPHDDSSAKGVDEVKELATNGHCNGISSSEIAKCEDAKPEDLPISGLSGLPQSLSLAELIEAELSQRLKFNGTPVHDDVNGEDGEEFTPSIETLSGDISVNDQFENIASDELPTAENSVRPPFDDHLVQVPNETEEKANNPALCQEHQTLASETDVEDKSARQDGEENILSLFQNCNDEKSTDQLQTLTNEANLPEAKLPGVDTPPMQPVNGDTNGVTVEVYSADEVTKANPECINVVSLY